MLSEKKKGGRTDIGSTRSSCRQHFRQFGVAQPERASLRLVPYRRHLGARWRQCADWVSYSLH